MLNASAVAATEAIVAWRASSAALRASSAACRRASRVFTDPLQLLAVLLTHGPGLLGEHAEPFCRSSGRFRECTVHFGTITLVIRPCQIFGLFAPFFGLDPFQLTRSLVVSHIGLSQTSEPATHDPNRIPAVSQFHSVKTKYGSDVRLRFCQTSGRQQ